MEGTIGSTKIVPAIRLQTLEPFQLPAQTKKEDCPALKVKKFKKSAVAFQALREAISAILKGTKREIEQLRSKKISPLYNLEKEQKSLTKIKDAPKNIAAFTAQMECVRATLSEIDSALISQLNGNMGTKKGTFILEQAQPALEKFRCYLATQKDYITALAAEYKRLLETETPPKKSDSGTQAKLSLP